MSSVDGDVGAETLIRRFRHAPVITHLFVIPVFSVPPW
jgi:hypothetical protein